MAAMVCCSLISASSFVVIANPKTRNAINISIPSLYNPLSFPSSSRYISRRSCQVRATTLQEKDEKVNVEDSFRTRSISADEGKLCDADQSEVTPGMVERWVIKIEQNLNVLLTDSVIRILDTLYHDRHYARFFVLETIARVPYFAFISVLHLYETFGWWRRADYIKVHFAESWNELHHLLIMEELGGNAAWFDRFLAQHMAIFYYFMTVIMYALSPRMAYHFSECVERHAYSTYDKFIKLQEEELKTLPAPEIAIKYYMNEDLYMFDEFQTDRIPNTRRPKIENLYDVFVNIRDDEAEHFKTMMACQTHGKLRSPHSVANDLVKSRDDDEDSDSGCVVPAADCEGIVDCVKKSLTSPVYEH